METVETRPNIRIEIKNNLLENDAMEVDNTPEEDSAEEGEIQEKIDPMETRDAQEWNNVEGFTTGVDIFDKKEQEKRQERAQRFGLKETEVNNFSEEDLLNLYTSLGVTSQTDTNIRFEAIHLRGTDEMSTDEVFKYFEKYAPAHIEWISDESCNIVWLDKVSAARVLHFESKPIKGMPIEGPCNPFENEQEPVKTGRSILLIDNDNERQVELEKEEKEESINSDNFVSITDISVPIPPGYWRLGTPHSKAKFLLFRFALVSDQKPLRAERFSEYYKRYGNPNFGGMVGLISESRRRKFRGIFSRNKEIDSKNPWGDLAETWDDSIVNPTEVEPNLTTDVHVDVKTNGEKPEILKRLGRKRASSPLEQEEDDEQMEKKSRIPRMRMYADEEEAKIKRKKQLMTLKQIPIKPMVADLVEHQTRDLRKLITNTSKKSTEPPRDHGLTTKNKYREDVPRFRSDVEVKQNVLVKERTRRRSPKPNKRYESKLRSDEYPARFRRRSFTEDEPVESGNGKTKSKVTVVIRKQNKPTVASTVWSRIDEKRKKSQRGWNKSQSDSSDTSSSSDSSSDSDSNENQTQNIPIPTSSIHRPGFSSGPDGGKQSNLTKSKSPLRIEISNDHFKEE